jgi:hypothetical protein
MSDFSKETIERICSHMNADHAVTVYAMAKAKLGRKGTISNATLNSITFDCCQIQTILCDGDLCQVEKIIYPFEPPLENASQIRSRLIEIHHRVCQPRLRDPLAWAVFAIYASLVWFHIVYDGNMRQRMVDENQLFIRNLAPYVSSTHLVNALYGFVQSTFLGHSVLAAIVSYHCRKTLKLSFASTMYWLVAVSASGLPIVQQFLELLAIQKKAPSLKKQ